MLIEVFDNIHTLVDAQAPTVEGNVVVLRVTPLHIGIKAVIGCTALVFVLQTLLRGLLPLPVHFYNPLRPEGHVCVDKDPQAVRFVPENVVRAPAYNDAGALLCQLGDDLILDLPEVVRIVGPGGTVRKGGG